MCHFPMYEETEREAKHRRAREKAFAEGRLARRIGWARNPRLRSGDPYDDTVTSLHARDAWLWGWDTEDRAQQRREHHAVA